MFRLTPIPGTLGTASGRTARLIPSFSGEWGSPTPTPSSIPTAFTCTIVDAGMSIDPFDAIIKDA